MIIIDEVNQRDITEVLHFTTNSGFLGMLAQSQVLPNSKLHKEDTLAFIFKQNSESRKEKNPKWLDYINLSVSKLNYEFFGYSQYIHRGVDMFWVVLSFSTEILEHEGVFFTTTNNIYPSCNRSQGYKGFVDMFNNPIEGKFQVKYYRSDEHLPSWTTCEQAEVLYPDGLSFEYLKKIYVPDEASKSCVKAQMSLYNKSIETLVDPSVFKR
ncbi:DarT ssDNA thymidine ADP-ribosyltransferase family protein [Shewanella marina]|uniref:DarT ssDNA thymidine ADP-ribosyltransferase family protein n=1 Tax=Shewanella marina TaxID=487319 RepID=UPI00046F9C98|nr:DarT ssDNA thymidine ADP-ribosyltransferase family protein [Shewanella marina]